MKFKLPSFSPDSVASFYLDNDLTDVIYRYNSFARQSTHYHLVLMKFMFTSYVRRLQKITLLINMNIIIQFPVVRSVHWLR